MDSHILNCLSGGVYITTWHILESTSNWNPYVLIRCVSLVLDYGAANRFRFSKETVPFVSGVFVLFIALLSSPLNEIGHIYLFSAHMAQHILLLLIVPFY
ncbi:MAG: hypothetical protein C4291_02065 [Candidatus Dadabacteria bacterium]